MYKTQYIYTIYLYIAMYMYLCVFMAVEQLYIQTRAMYVYIKLHIYTLEQYMYVAVYIHLVYEALSYQCMGPSATSAIPERRAGHARFWLARAPWTL
jgi:hypothetical protein